MVAPLAGAWIEISRAVNAVVSSGSLPLRERGLKYKLKYGMMTGMLVAPLAGAWIEIAVSARELHFALVAPLAGAWIEIDSCGVLCHDITCRSPCGSVD